MAKKLDDALMASMSSRRDPVKLAADMATTPFAQLAAQVKEATPISLASIYVSPFQRRVDAAGTVDEAPDDYLADLAATIEREGLLNPIIVRALDSSVDFSNKNRALESSVAVLNGVRYELIAGENRVKAFGRLGRETIPAKVLHLTDIEAARALTVDNLVRKGMTDWELYLHIAMLRDVGAASTQPEFAALLGCSRQKVGQLECYGKLPAPVKDILGKTPGLLGATQVQALSIRQFLDEHPDAVVEAVEAVAAQRIRQSEMVAYIERKLRASTPTTMRLTSDRPDYQLTVGRARVKVATKAGETRISGDVDIDALRALLEEHLARLVKQPDADEAAA
jgi:ParB/RepB/Spo0J family partition protein